MDFVAFCGLRKMVRLNQKSWFVRQKVLGLFVLVVCVRVRAGECSCAYICVREFDRSCVRVCVCACMQDRERESARVRETERQKDRERSEISFTNAHLLSHTLTHTQRERDCSYHIIEQTYDVELYSRRHPMEFDAGTRPFASFDAPSS